MAVRQAATPQGLRETLPKGPQQDLGDSTLGAGLGARQDDSCGKGLVLRQSEQLAFTLATRFFLEEVLVIRSRALVPGRAYWVTPSSCAEMRQVGALGSKPR